jgi:hypothetical protein
MNGKIANELVLTQDTYKDSAYSSITELSKALQTDAEWLSPIVTFLSYTDTKYYMKKNYPFLYQTEGNKNVESLTKLGNANFEYKYPIIGRLKTTNQVAVTSFSSTDQVGKNGMPFQMVFADRQFSIGQTVYPYGASSKLQCRVLVAPEKVSNGYKYTFKIFNSSPTLFLPYQSLVAGAVWSAGLRKVAFEGSKGGESRSQLPSTATNMVTLTRNTYKFKGNVDKKVMKFSIPIDGQKFTTYMDWELFLSKIYFKEEQEEDLLWSQYGKTASGDFSNYDDDAPITSGAGIEQQIPSSNSDTYSFLTLNKWKNIVREVTYGINDDITDLHVYTGRGGMEEFDNAVKSGFVNFLSSSNQLANSDKFIQGANSWDMTFGSYFNKYRVVDGQVITVHYHPLLDFGRRAKAAIKHPITGFPMTSHNFYFIDQSQVDGKPNLQYVSEDGREKMKIVQGMTGMPVGFTDSVNVSTDKDETSIEWMKSHGILIRRPSSCFKLECTLSGF